MKPIANHTAAILLTFALLLGLTSCKAKEEVHPINWESAPAYTAETAALPVETGNLAGCCTDGEYMYILADEKTGDAVRSVLCRVRLEDGTAEVMEGYQSSNAPEDAAVGRLGPMLAPDGTLWLYEIWYVSHFDLPEDFDGETDRKADYLSYRAEFHHMCQLDPVTGQQQKVVDLSDAVRALAKEGAFDEASVAVDGGGNICFAWNGGVAVLDQEGICLFTLEADMPVSLFASAGGRLALLPDGRAAALVTLPGGKREVRTIDPERRDWGEDFYPVPSGVGAVYSGRGACLFYYIQDGILYGVAEGEIIPQRLLPLADTRLKGYSGTACFALLEENRAALLLRTMQNGASPYEAELRLALLSPTDQLPEDAKVKIVYGAIGNHAYIRNRIEKFNGENDTYYIEYRDYTEGGFETADTVEARNAVRDAARLRLQGEIAAGRAPDIMGSSLPLDIYAGRGYLEDLWPWIDGDRSISRDDLMVHVLECASTDGKLCTIGSSFTVETAVTSRAVAGDRTGWTLEELLEACGGAAPDIYLGQPRFLYEMNAEEALWLMLEMDLDRYLDWETGECRFDSEEFKDLLRLCTSAGTGEIDYGADTPLLWESGPVLCQASLREVSDLTAWDIYFGGPETLSAGSYEERLWDAGVLYTFVSEYNGQECANYSNAPFVSRLEAAMDGRLGWSVAGGAASGMPDRELYATFAGAPAGSGTGSSFDLQDRMSISAASQVKEGAWAFVRTLLLPGGYMQHESFEGMDESFASGFPLNRADFEALLEPRWCRVDGDGEIIPDKNGQPIEAPVDNFPVRIGEPLVMAAYQMAPTQAQMDRFWALYDAIEHMSRDARDLMDIIREQVQPYFAGDKSLQETVELIQKRASLYVNENK